MRIKQTAIATKYDTDQFTIATGVSDYNVLTTRGPDGANKLWVNGEGKYIELLHDQNISIKLNDSANPAIVCYKNRGLIILTDIVRQVENIFITNASGSTVTIDIIIT